MRPTEPLDNPVRASLLSAHHRYAVSDGRALAYRPEHSPFMALPDDPDEQDCAALARLVRGREVAILFGSASPAGWVERLRFDALQLVAPAAAIPPDPVLLDSVPWDLVPPQPDPGLVVLGPDDVDEMLDLAARTEPGPFFARTPELGRYLGRREDGRLVAMAGERMRFAGWTEISAVCTDPAVRGRGLAGRLVRAVWSDAANRGDRAFLHVMRANVGALRIYESLGFVVRRPMSIVAVSPPRRLS